MAALCISNVLGGCVISMIFTESLAKSCTNPMHLVSFVSFILIPVVVLFQTPQVLSKRHIPVKSYSSIILCSFVVNVLNNHTLNFDVPVPLFIIFRSGTLLSSVLLTYIMQGKIYSWNKILSVVTVTCGLIWFTLASSNYESKEEYRIKFLWIDYLPWPRFFTGMMAQTLCLFLSAYMGIKQEMVFTQYGKHSDEMFFYSNILTLPLFIFLWPDISHSISQFSVIKNLEVTESITVPLLWIELIAACVFHIFCARSVVKLTSVTSTLNVNMILALRKFLSLFLSAYIFGNELNIYHFLATCLVIGGSLSYGDVFEKLKEKYKQKYIKKNE